MNCTEYREHLLDSVGQELTTVVKDHLAVCVECRHLNEIQLALHASFLPASAERLNPEFRQALGKRLAQEGVFNWPDFLPDIAHLSGCAIATLVSVFILPWPAAPVLIAGAAFTGVTYFVQAKLRDAIQGEVL